MLSKQTNFKLPKNKQILKSKINIKTNQTKLYKVELKGKHKNNYIFLNESQGMKGMGNIQHVES